MPVYILPDNLCWFPPSEIARDDGLLAIGGDLSVERLLAAYSAGIFPWYNPNETIQWWCPKERFVIFPEKIRISRSLEKILRQDKFLIRIYGKSKNTETILNCEDFVEIITACKTMREGDTWLGDDMLEAYRQLYMSGHIIGVGVYNSGDMALVGGLYGVSIGRCFFGESMFSKRTNGSKIALVKLCQSLAEDGVVFVDCQFHTAHLERMGGEFLDWREYKRLLQKGLKSFQ